MIIPPWSLDVKSLRICTGNNFFRSHGFKNLPLFSKGIEGDFKGD
jgi:hypothetical protein